MLAIVLYVLTAIFRWELPRELLRLSLLPIVFAYYYLKHKQVDLLVWVLLISYYTGDVLRSVHDRSLLPYMLSAYAIGHFCFMYISYKCIKDLKVKRLLFSALPFIVLWFVYFNYSIKDIFGAQMGEHYFETMAYSIILSAFMIVALIKYFNDEQKVYLFTVIIALCIVGGDVVSGLHDYLAKLRVFEISFAIATAAGYFFLMRFIIEFDFNFIRENTE